MNAIASLWTLVINAILVALLFLLWKMWEDVIMHGLMAVRKIILGRIKVKVENKEEGK